MEVPFIIFLGLAYKFNRPIMSSRVPISFFISALLKRITLSQCKSILRQSLFLWFNASVAKAKPIVFMRVAVAYTDLELSIVRQLYFYNSFLDCTHIFCFMTEKEYVAFGNTIYIN